jgi:predicted transcriptional regulator
MRLGKMMRLYRLFECREQQDVAAEIGIAPSVLSHLESGKKCDVSTFALVFTWLSKQDDGKQELVR